jgi:4-amino-4-deoxy-L-arabinose transferase-like glycosyltransferase
MPAKDYINSTLFKDIRFWIVLFFIVRLLGITNPPLEVAHSWRQTTVTMVARNFYETDPNILYPRVDFAGEMTGITGMEFPFLNYLIYLASLVFGYGHWYGRMINLMVSSLGIFYFFKLARKYFEQETAFYASLVLLSSIWFAYSRKIMPDTFSMSLVIMGFYHGTNYLDGTKKRSLNLLLYFVFMLLGILSKLPSGFILVLFLLFLFDKKVDLKSKSLFAAASLLFLVPVFAWYFYWIPYLVEKYGFWHFFMGKSLSAGIAEISQNLRETLAHFYDFAMKFSGFIVFVFGIVMSIVHKKKELLLVLILSLLSFSLVVFKAGFTFSAHAYYIIPFVPVMALFCGYGISIVANQRLKVLIIAVIMLEGILNQQHDFFLKPKDAAILSLERTLDRFSEPNDLILINSNDFPTPMYFTHRKGWIATNGQISDERYIESLKTKGCRYIVILKQSFGSDMALKYRQVYNDEFYSIYRLQ